MLAGLLPREARRPTPAPRRYRFEKKIRRSAGEFRLRPVLGNPSNMEARDTIQGISGCIFWHCTGKRDII